MDVADRAGVLPDRLAGIAPLWYLVPVMGGVAVVAIALHRRRLGGVATTTLGSLVGVGGFLLHRSPLVVRFGATAAVGVGMIAVTCGLALLVTAAEERE